MKDCFVKIARFGFLINSITMALFFSANLWAVGPCKKLTHFLNRNKPFMFGAVHSSQIPKIMAVDLLPASFIDRVEKEVGPVRVFQKAVYGTLFVEIFAIDGGEFTRPILQAQLIPDPRHPVQLRIEGLLLSHPSYRSLPNERLRGTQSTKGLPADVFRFAKNRLIDLAKNWGIETIHARGVQNYLVLSLYRRVVGMRPADQESLRTISFLDELYNYARRELPTDLRVKSVGEFSDILGNPTSKIYKSPGDDAWEYFREMGVPAPRMELLYNSNGRIMGFILKKKIYFIDPFSNEVLHFSKLSYSSRVHLVLDLNL